MMLYSLVPLVPGAILLFTNNAHAACFDPSPAFPPPVLDGSDPILRSAFEYMEHTLAKLASDDAFDTTSFSVEVTSSQSTLWSYHHTAKELNSSRPGANPVSNESFYRIASITKTFTTLAILKQAAAGNLSLDDPVTKYLPDLEGNIPWKDITLRTLASQLSGIPKDWSHGDLTGLPDPTIFGLPPANNTDLPSCEGYNERHAPCNTSDLFHALSLAQPLFSPNQQSTYSNTAFELLGLVLANVSGLSYEDAIASLILEPLDITAGATFVPPPDNVSVLPAGIQWYHDVNQGVHNPTGGLFMTTFTMSSFLRYVLSIFNSPSTLSLDAGNWLTPRSFTASPTSFYGMPWEIFRFNNILEESKRAVSLFTKGGGVPGYTSIVAVVPEYGLGITVFVAGNEEMLAKLRDEVSIRAIRAAEEVAAQQTAKWYGGRYIAEDGKLNSSVTLAYDKLQGLWVQEWVSNGTEVIAAFAKQYPGFVRPGAPVQLVPTLLYVDEARKRGEKWRFLVVPPRPQENETQVWDESCITNVDFLMYDGRPFNEVVFWDTDGDDRRMGSVDFTGFKVRLRREEIGKQEMAVQDL